MLHRSDFDVYLPPLWGTQVATIRCESPGCGRYARWWLPIEAAYACGWHRDLGRSA